MLCGRGRSGRQLIIKQAAELDRHASLTLREGWLQEGSAERLARLETQVQALREALRQSEEEVERARHAYAVESHHHSLTLQRIAIQVRARAPTTSMATRHAAS